MSRKIFYSNGKLLLTAEYVVMDGAKSLALPTIFGQYLDVEQNNSETISWKSYDFDKSVWINVVFPFAKIIEKTFISENPIENKLAEILYQTHLFAPYFLSKNKGYRIETRLTFPRNWGLGSSSTLINNIAKWQDINPYQLLKNTFGGSGYDIACAENNTAILFCLKDKVPLVKAVNFNPKFSENLFFVYLNKKQDSRDAVAEYRKKQINIATTLSKINQITSEIQKTKSLPEFACLLEEHEQIMSKVLNLPTTKKRLFSDFDGIIKSLGAWEGDFVLAVSEKNPTQYFRQKGFDIIIPYKKMIL